LNEDEALPPQHETTHGRRTRKNAYLVTYQGKTQTLAEWSRELGIEYAPLHNRFRERGWTAEAAFTRPVAFKSSRQPLTYDGRTQSLDAWARELRVSRWLIATRLLKGWSVEQALTTKGGTAA
jgi:hypothetical protein